MRRSIGPALAAGSLAITLARSSGAFVVPGHDAVEAATYKRIITTPKVDDGRGGKVSGREAIAFLIRRGFLARPRCFEAKSPKEDADCRAEARTRPIVSWPELHSSSADLVSERQFSTNGQCFHFMAATSYAWTTPIDPKTGFFAGFSRDAYFRCTRLASELFVETLRDPAGANEDNRGLYALMHIVADSFSEAHVERDASYRVLYLKPWQARGSLSYLIPGHGAGLRFLAGPTHHGFIDDRDEDFVRREEPACAALKNPYALTEACLSVRGRRTVDALEDLVLVIHSLAREREAGMPVDGRAAFVAFASRQLASPFVAPDTRPPFWNDREWNSAYVFGFRFRDHPVPGATDLSVLAGASLFTDLTLPLVPFFSVEAGCRRVAGACRLELGVDPLTLLLPVTEGFAIGATPLSIIGSPGDPSQLSIGANVVRADLHLLDALWLSVSGPRYAWAHQRFDAELMAVSMGFSWNGKTPPLESSNTPPERPARARADSRTLEAEGGQETWKPAPLGASYRRRATTFVVHVAGGTVIPDAQQGAYSIGGLEVLFDRDRWDRRAGFALGARADTEYRPTEDGSHYGAVASPVARFYLVPNRLAIEADPAMIDAGAFRRRDGHVEPFIDAALGGGVAAIPLGHVEIGLETPRFSYRTGSRVPGTNLGVRLGLALE